LRSRCRSRCWATIPTASGVAPRCAWAATAGCPRSRDRSSSASQPDHIDLHLREPDLGPERIAKAHFISTRYVHELFQPEGTTVSAWIRARRLEGARRDLADPELAGLTISALAARWGFSDPARFSRAFRAVYGCSPTEARAVATRRRLDWA
jgi:AraC-like DNA-binding protein